MGELSETGGQQVAATDSQGISAFRTTHWTAVLDAASPQSTTGQEAFGQLYCDYWYPLYAFVRRRGCSPQQAEDITQDFFTHLISKQALAGLEREGGKFRSFLLHSLKNFLANEWDRRHAQKRGAGVEHIHLDAVEGEARFASDRIDAQTPEMLFERQWAFTLLAKVVGDLQTECEVTGKRALFQDMRPHLQGDRQGLSYADIGVRHNLSEGAVKVAVHRLRRRYGELLREEIARTVSAPAEVQQELRYLISIVAS